LLSDLQKPSDSILYFHFRLRPERLTEYISL
jgi:hypothetical protein